MTRARKLRSDNIWPGFVDALATLLLVIIFLLVVFMLAHFFLSQALTGRDEALQRLNERVAELSQLLSMEREAAADTRISVSQLSASLQTANRDRDDLRLRLRETTQRALDAESALAAVRQNVEADRETITARLSEIERLNRDIAALRGVRDDLEDEVAILAVALDSAGAEADRLNAELSSAEIEEARREAALQAALAELTGVRDRSQELVAELSTFEERTLLAQRELEERELRLAEMQDLYNRTADELDVKALSLTEEQRVSAEALQQVTLLNQQLLALREQLQALEAAVGAAEQRDAEQQVTIETLGSRLNAALAQRVEELSRYRSEFFGRLREVLGDRTDIRVVGDRFVFQSEVLFAAGDDSLGEAGRAQLTQLATTLLQITAAIPAEINWILRVDGHTDAIPINTPRFPSNWELSTARAVSVVTFLIDRGIPEVRLAATGFGEFQPLDTGESEVSLARNRRIELKLTER